MSARTPSILFDRERAAVYDRQFAKLAPLRDALYLLMRLRLGDLPDGARVLCVGAGTGAEVIDLAHAFPSWRFTAVEPSGPMLDMCRRRTAELGIAARCTFHEGYLGSLPAAEPFDAATCLLVSQFVTDKARRRELFSGICARLREHGWLVTADLAADTSAPSWRERFEDWARLLRGSDAPRDEIDRMLAALGRDVAVLPQEEIEAMLASSGFEPPVLFFRALLMHAWYARKCA
jgi:tRNA (cmo5U34)-methyltransferase